MPYPRHETELQRQAFRDCAHAMRHPKEIPALLRGSWQQTRDYYAGRDVAGLERGEIVELLAWTRRIAIKMSGLSFILGAMLVLLVLERLLGSSGYGWFAVATYANSQQRAMVHLSDASEDGLIRSYHLVLLGTGS
ncbi:hypothetical protein F4810DRAFT_715106 [Camillea tinctor]|nr:hypothetical protein F4810DRAFT_715106 [Camillea tinctor]